MKLETLQKEMIAAMKAKDKTRKDVISSLIAAVKKYGIDIKGNYEHVDKACCKFIAKK